MTRLRVAVPGMGPVMQPEGREQLRFYDLVSDTFADTGCVIKHHHGGYRPDMFKDGA